MNILFISPIHIDEASLNGTSLVIINLYNELSSRHDIKIIPLTSLQSPLSNTRQYRLFKLLANLLSSIIFPKSYASTTSITFNSLSSIIHKYDKIVVFREDMMVLLFRLALNNTKKLVFYPIDFFPRLYQSLARSSSPIHRIYYLSQTLKSLLSYKLLTAFRIPTIFVSSTDAQDAIKVLNADRTYTIPNGLSIDPKASDISPLPRHTYNILFSGDLRYKPNLQAYQFIRDHIFPCLSSFDAEITICIAGRGIEPKVTYNKANHMIKLVTTGDVPSLTDYYLAADLYLSPLFSGSGIKNKILSAFYFGLPILATKESLEGVNSAQNRLNYLECNSRSASDWCVAIQTLMTSPTLASSLSEHGRVLLDKSYLWSQSASHLEEILYRNRK